MTQDKKDLEMAFENCCSEINAMGVAPVEKTSSHLMLTEQMRGRAATLRGFIALITAIEDLNKQTRGMN